MIIYDYEFGKQAIRLAITWCHWIVCHSACRSSEDQDKLDCRWIRPRSIGFIKPSWSFPNLMFLGDCLANWLSMWNTWRHRDCSSPSSSHPLRAPELKPVENL